MFDLLHIVKGLHPGLYLDRELKKRQLPKGKFALSIMEYPQTLVAITKGKRRMNPGLSLKIENELAMEEGSLMLLQAMHDVVEEKRKQPKSQGPNTSKFRPVLFWETDFTKLNWNLHSAFIIRRVMERGNRMEKDELISHYGEEFVNRALQ